MYRSGWRRLSVLSCSSTSRSDMTCFRLFKLLLKVYLALRKTGDLLIVWWSLYHPGEKKKVLSWIMLNSLDQTLDIPCPPGCLQKGKKKNHMLIISVKWNKDTGLLHMDLWLLCKNYWFLLYFFFFSIRRHNLLHGLSNIYEGFGSKTR